MLDGGRVYLEDPDFYKDHHIEIVAKLDEEEIHLKGLDNDGTLAISQDL